MKLKFCLRGIHLSYGYNIKTTYPVIWIHSSNDPKYPQNLLAYVSKHYKKIIETVYWANYILKKLE